MEQYIIKGGNPLAGEVEIPNTLAEWDCNLENWEECK